MTRYYVPNNVLNMAEHFIMIIYAVDSDRHELLLDVHS